METARSQSNWNCPNIQRPCANFKIAQKIHGDNIASSNIYPRKIASFEMPEAEM